MRSPFTLALLTAPLAALASSAPSATAAPAVTSAATSHGSHCSGDTTAPKTPQILPGYGGGGFAIATSVPAAQAFFDNGMQLAHAFAHTAAIAAFAEAARLDPECAMCLWGQAWASGPTINYTIEASEAVPLARLVERARTLAARGSEKERLLIDALALRYRPGSKPFAADRAYAEAMEAIARRWPADDELAVLAADAWMTLDSNANRLAHTDREVALLEAVLARNPDYTPAIHFYIHATEIGGYPERAEKFADRLPALAPAASHLIHMPSHTYYHVGRYQDAVDANMHAVAIGRANARRLGMPEPDGVWDLPYHAHNVQYGVGAALISGDAKSALALSDPLVARVAAGKSPREGSFAQMVAGTAYFAEARFADPGKVLALPRPPARYPYAIAYWHYARGEAQARLGDARAVSAEAAAITLRFPWTGDDAAKGAARMARIAKTVLEGRAAMLEQDPAAALAAFRRAARLQEARAFQSFADPPAFWYPVRRDVAAALLALGRPGEAVKEADATLEAMPREPETLAIRGRALAALEGQGSKAAER
ncbi:MAG: hypothetical protein ACM3YM_01010 [Sphingomonadales bacterium]